MRLWIGLATLFTITAVAVGIGAGQTGLLVRHRDAPSEILWGADAFWHLFPIVEGTLLGILLLTGAFIHFVMRPG